MAKEAFENHESYEQGAEKLKGFGYYWQVELRIESAETLSF